MEHLVSEPDYYPECKQCKALMEAKERLRVKLIEYNYSNPEATIYCTDLRNILKTEFSISLESQVKMISFIADKDTLRFRPSWENIVACPGKIMENPLVTPTS